MTFTNWLTVDPLRHPRSRSRKEDSSRVDAKHLRATAAWPGGFFASYHAYPYYPDFLRLASYEATRRRREPDPYAGYLHELRAHHGGQAVMITEFGVPTGNGVAHLGPLGRDQGDHSEQEAGRDGRRHARATSATRATPAAMLFEWTDEWFKITWNTMDIELPADRRAALAQRADQRGAVRHRRRRGRQGRASCSTAASASGRETRSRRSPSARAGREVRAIHDEEYLYLRLC